MLQIFPNTPKIEWVRRFPILFGASVALTVACIAVIAIHGLNYSIDFIGGHQIHVRLPVDVGDQAIRDQIESLAHDARVQRVGDPEEHEFLIFVRGETSAKPEAAAAESPAKARATAPEGSTPAAAPPADAAQPTPAAPPADGAQPAPPADAAQPVRERPASAASSQQASIATKIETALVEGLKLPAGTDLILSVDYIGPQVGAELRNQGIMATLAALFFVLIYMAFRFDLFFAPGAIVCLTHDISVTLAVMSIFGLEFSLQGVAAVLTIIGYSINDTIVVYDRVRENLVRKRGQAFRSLVNDSVNETLSRTLLTGTTTFLVVIVLWYYGIGGIREFAIALFVGILAGTYSSISIATPLYLFLHERFGRGEQAGRRVAA